MCRLVGPLNDRLTVETSGTNPRCPVLSYPQRDSPGLEVETATLHFVTVFPPPPQRDSPGLEVETTIESLKLLIEVFNPQRDSPGLEVETENSQISHFCRFRPQRDSPGLEVETRSAHSNHNITSSSHKGILQAWRLRL